jgi:hypothetical protein
VHKDLVWTASYALRFGYYNCVLHLERMFRV